MPPQVREFWQLLAKSQIHSIDKVRGLMSEADGKGCRSPQEIVTWLCEKSAISNYHAKVLLGGQPGPFVFGDYVVTRNTGSSSRFAARHRPTSHPVLLEFLDETQIDSDAELAPLARLIAGMTQLNHPNLAPCHELVQLPMHVFTVHEAPTGPTVAKILENQQTVPVVRAFRWICAVTSALDRLHQVGIPHGNISIDEMTVHEDVWLHAYPFTMYLATKGMTLEDAKRRDIQNLGTVLASLLLRRNVAITPADEILASLSTIPGMNPTAVQIVERLLISLPAGFESAAQAVRAIEQLLPDAPPRVYPTHKTKVRFERQTDQQQANPQHDLATELGAIDLVRPQVAVLPTIATEEPSTRRPRKDNWFVTLSFVTLPLLLVIATLVSLLRTKTPRPMVTSSNTDQIVVNGRSSGVPHAAETTTQNRQIPIDDGQSLWASPTNGEPLNFSFVPQGGQLFIYVRPQAFLEQSEGSRILKALGPKFERGLSDWEKSADLPFSRLDACLFTVSIDANGLPQLTTRVELSDDVFQSSKWLTAERKSEENGVLARDGELACLICDSPSNETPAAAVDGVPKRWHLVLGPINTVAEIARSESVMPILRREFEELRSESDRSKHFTILGAPSFLLGDGQGLLPDSYAKFPNYVDTFLGPGIRAILFTSHLADGSNFTELRLAANAESKRPLLDRLPQKLASLNSDLRPIIDAAASDDYWSTFANRMSRMIEFTTSNTRTTIEGSQVIANVSLPDVAAHNFVLATELALASQASTTTQSRAKASLTLDEIVVKKMDFAIEQQSLEFAVRDLITQVNDSFPNANGSFLIKIVGADLQLDGITRNQQIRNLDVSDQSIGEILTTLCQRANPVTASAANHPDQKLVWVVASDPDNPNNPCVLLTTRQAAARKGLELPDLFHSE